MSQTTNPSDQSKLCPNCKLGYMQQHPEWPHLWLKCGTCGFCKPIKNSKLQI